MTWRDSSATTPKRTLIRLARLRWHIEHDYREVKPEAAPGKAGTTLQRLGPNPSAAMALDAVLVRVG